MGITRRYIGKYSAREYATLKTQHVTNKSLYIAISWNRTEEFPDRDRIDQAQWIPAMDDGNYGLNIAVNLADSALDQNAQINYLGIIWYVYIPYLLVILINVIIYNTNFHLANVIIRQNNLCQFIIILISSSVEIIVCSRD